MKRNEVVWDMNKSQIIMEPFLYSNKCEGYMCSDDKGHKFNLTLNFDLAPDDVMLLKMFGEAEQVNRWLLTKTDMFKKTKVYSVGLNYAQGVTLNPEWYEES